MTRRRSSSREDYYDPARYGGEPSTTPLHHGGILARFNGFCWSCDRSIVAGQSRVVKRKNAWICVGCAERGEE